MTDMELIHISHYGLTPAGLKLFDFVW